MQNRTCPDCGKPLLNKRCDNCGYDAKTDSNKFKSIDERYVPPKVLQEGVPCPDHLRPQIDKWLNKGKRKVIDDNAKKQETRKALAEMMNKKTDPFQDLTAEEQIALERGETK
jgi:hypothetical protein|tara:strand:- start:3410 stop:3748 length:339 start_codon:yes stop_codon:yes gene_type:complete